MINAPALSLALDAIAGLVPRASRWVGLNVGSGSARNVTRKQVAFDVVDMVVVSTTDAHWYPAEVVAEERYTSYSVYDAAVGGRVLWSGDVIASRVSPGDEFVLPAGVLSLEIA